MLLQLVSLCEHFGLWGPQVDVELDGFDEGFTFAPRCDWSLLASLNQRKFGTWIELQHKERSFVQRAAKQWEGLFQHQLLDESTRHGTQYHQPLDMLRDEVMRGGVLLPIDSHLH